MMNKDILRYKYRFVSVALLLGYAFIHTQLCGVYTEVSLGQLIHFSAQLPYEQRLLVPALANLLSHIFPLAVDTLFFFIRMVICQFVLF